MSMQAVIMAGGTGTRLRPLTCALPKPLSPLCGAPVMDYTLQLLAKHKLHQAHVTLWYRPQDVIDTYGKERCGVALRYAIESKPLGTAGSILLAVPNAQDTVLVLSGDGLTNVDLSAALAFHRARHAAATLVLKHVDVPLPYGVVVTNAEGCIERFIEKPDWGHVVSSLVNTGVYLLEPEVLSLIPREEAFDFGRDLFPALLRNGFPLYGYESAAYWCDIGSPEAFLQAQGDLLRGITGFSVADPGIRALSGVEISEDSYIAPDAKLSPGARILHSCVLSGAKIGENASLNGAIICERAQVGRGAELAPGCVLGAGAAIGAFGRMQSGVKLWPGIALPDYSVWEASVLQAPASLDIVNGRARFAVPGQAALLAGAFLQTQKAESIIVMHDGSALSDYHLLCGALSAYGAGRVWMLGRGSLGLLSHAIMALHADGGMLSQQEGILLLDKNGLLLDAQAAAALTACALRQELPAPVRNAAALRAHAPLRAAYLSHLAERFSVPQGVSVSLQCKDRFLRTLARNALLQAGHTVSPGAPMTLCLSPGQVRVQLSQHTLDDLQQWLLCARALQLQGQTVYDTLELDDEAFSPCDNSLECLSQRRVLQDGLSCALLLLTLFARESPEEALSRLPALHLRQTDIPCAMPEKGKVLEALLSQATPRPQGGLSARQKDAQAVIRPDPTLPLMHVAASSRDAEQAQELCDALSGQIHQILHPCKKDFC